MEDKTKLQHKLLLAKETPEPIYDLSECEITELPWGVFERCHVFRKKILRLDCNSLTSLSPGGNLYDLAHLKVLDLHCNNFTSIPNEILLLRNLNELYLHENHLKKLPESLCELHKLIILNVSNNSLRALPAKLGLLQSLTHLYARGNKSLKTLPKSIAQARNLCILELDSMNFVYPRKEIVSGGVELVRKFICKDIGIEYLEQCSDSPVSPKEVVKSSRGVEETDFEAKIWTLEDVKREKLKDFLEIERLNEEVQKQEIEVALAQKDNKKRLLAHLCEEESRLNDELMKIQQGREVDRFRLIEQIQNTEQNADLAIRKLLQELSGEPLAQLLEQEKMEENRLLSHSNYSEALSSRRRDEILAEMQQVLEIETKNFRTLCETRQDMSRSILDQQLEDDVRLSDYLRSQDEVKVDLVARLQQDGDLQKMAVAALLERGDARSWGLVQQVRLVESQLAALTNIEIEKRNLKVDQHLNDLAEKRTDLSFLLLDLLDRQKERRSQLLSMLQTLEDNSHSKVEEFWLRQYQTLLDKFPEGLCKIQSEIDPILVQALLMSGVINCLPFLAHLIATNDKQLNQVTDNDLVKVGVTNSKDRRGVLDAFYLYWKEKQYEECGASAPPENTEAISQGATAPPLNIVSDQECVICMEVTPQVVFVPCGHLCCCLTCSKSVQQCPLCRLSIDKFVRVFMAS